MRQTVFIVRDFAGALLICLFAARGHSAELRNAGVTAAFGESGLVSLTDRALPEQVHFVADRWSLDIDQTTLRSADAKPRIKQSSASEIAYLYNLSGYEIEVDYRLQPEWRFVSKQITVMRAPNSSFVAQHIAPLDLEISNAVNSVYVPSSYLPQLGEGIEQSRRNLPAKDFGAFLRLAANAGLMLTVQNPYLSVTYEGNSARLAYSPEMQWKQEWGAFRSDIACIGIYKQSGERLSREMVLEWKPAVGPAATNGMDRAEIAAFTGCVRAFLIYPEVEPTSVEVGWTLNDYQIDVGTSEGKAEYKRVIDTAASLGIHHLLYAPGNSKLAERTESADAWSWEYVLWLNLGEKIRKGEWDPAKDALPADVTEMVAYSKSKHVGLLAYVYPSAPYAKDSAWLVKRPEEGGRFVYATLASREFQDYLLRNLIEFQRRTGITGYSFDYAFLNLPGSSSYAQWYGWRRVIEGLRRAVPEIVIDGRQSYQQYGPWSWLAGTYPHPTGTDEQPESFKPYPDLHFDRVSADRARFVNYWYRNYQFAPAEVIPGYATHQTERSMNMLPRAGDKERPEETIYTRYLPRDWDYLGFRYSFLSSIATGGWNNVVDMIPARDEEEWKHFSDSDKAWIRNWLQWTVEHKEYLRNTRTILSQPAMGNVDGTSAIVGNHGYLFVFNPNYKQMPADLKLDETIGLTQRGRYLLREVYPHPGRLIGKPGAGVWSAGDAVHLTLDGTSSTVFELMPATTSPAPLVFNAVGSDEGKVSALNAVLKGQSLEVLNVFGEPGTSQEIGVLLPHDARVMSMTVNARLVDIQQAGRYVSAQVRYDGPAFHQAQEITTTLAGDESLAGTFTVPQRVFEQLAERKKAWPIPWTTQDYDTTWLAPERLLLFVQFAEGTDSIHPTASLDGRPLDLKAAYSSTRVHTASFVGYYADLSTVTADKPHAFLLKLPEGERGKLQGVFFDNVEPQLTGEITR